MQPAMGEKRRASRAQCVQYIAPTHSLRFPDFEYSAHSLPVRLHRDILTIFPDLGAESKATAVLIVPTIQRACVNLLEFGDVQEAEKNRLLVRFFEWATLVRNALLAKCPHAWVDVTDPASGVAHFGRAGAIFPDVEGIRLVLKYKTIDAGGCRVAKHPQWGFAMYPATLFTNVDIETLQATLREVNEPPTPGNNV